MLMELVSVCFMRIYGLSCDMRCDTYTTSRIVLCKQCVLVKKLRSISLIWVAISHSKYLTTTALAQMATKDVSTDIISRTAIWKYWHFVT